MPWNIVWFERLMYASLLLAIVVGFFVMRREAETPADEESLSPAVLVGIDVALLTAFFVLWVLAIWLAARRRKGWARYVLAALFLVSLFLYVRNFGEIIELPFEGALNAVHLVMGLVALVLAFTGGARAWFARPTPSR
jgi:hypothetical protein